MHNICFEISYHLDDAGVPTYVAIRVDDFDAYSVPLPDAPRGEGETPMQAIIALCELLEKREDVLDSKAQTPSQEGRQ